MRIGIDASWLVAPALTGIEYSLLQLVRHLTSVDARHEYALYFRFRRRDEALRFASRVVPLLCERVQARVCRMPARLLNAIGRWVALERTLGACDVIHYPNLFLRTQRSGARVVTINDLIPLSHPQHCSPGLVAFFGREVTRAVREADAVIAASRHTRAELIRRLRVPAERIRVVYHGVDARFQPAPRAAVAALRERLGLRRPYLLSLGHAEARKNNQRLVEAVALCQSRGLSELELVVAGPAGLATPALEARIAELGLGGAVHRPGYVAAADLCALYTGAAAFVLPSLAEGFGLPALEAMACGTPLIASRCGALPEVVGDAGVLVEPTDAEEIADAIARVLGDSARAADLAERGRKRAGDFSWERTARGTVAVYEEAGA